MPRTGPCEEEGCKEQGFPCMIFDYETQKEEVSTHCPKHAQKNGFCMGCGIFCAGLESFDFGRHPGFCDNCQDEIDSNESPEDEDYYPDPYEDGPDLSAPVPGEFGNEDMKIISKALEEAKA